jgi:N-acetylneuraminate synthase
MTPSECKELSINIKRIYNMLGGEKKLSVSEIPVANFAFGSVVAIKNISIGEKLTVNNIWVRRPSTGDFSPIDFKKLLGKKVIKKVKKNTQLKKTDLS